MTLNDMFYLTEDDMDSVDFEATVAPDYRVNDDALCDPATDHHIQILLDSMTRIGGEVSRLRAEMDGLMDQNAALMETFDKLKDVLAAKGTLNLEDFDLACEVMEANTEALSQRSVPKLAN